MITPASCRCGGAARRILVATELAVTGIADAGNDVTAFVQAGIHGSDENLNIRMGAGELPDAFGCGEEAELFDATNAPSFQAFYRDRRRTAGGKHGVENKSDTGWIVVGEFVVVFDGLEGAFVAKQAEVKHAGVRDEIKNAVHHTQSGAENRNQPNVAGDPRPDGAGKRRRDGNAFTRKIVARFKKKHDRKQTNTVTHDSPAGAVIARVGEK